MTGRIVSPEEAKTIRESTMRGAAWNPFTLDLAFTVEQQAKQVAAALALHPRRSLSQGRPGLIPDWCSTCDGKPDYPCSTARALGVES